MKHILCLLLLTLYFPAARAQYFDTVKVYYEIGTAELNPQARATLDSLSENLAHKDILIYSYADYLGQERANAQLSDARAFGVRDYLTQKEIRGLKIKQCSGLGQLDLRSSAEERGNSASRRSEIFIRRDQKATLPTPSIAVKKEKEAPSVATLNTVDIGQTLQLRNIEFVGGTPIIMSYSYPAVDELYHALRRFPEVKICLEGHVCCCDPPDGYQPGTEGWNLSVERAKAIYNILLKNGIEPERLSYKGFGRSQPIVAEEKTESEAQMNRRVEIRVTEK
jgi:outer membrane protein OmpA-like peptidoglycan-associated protein